MSIVFLTTDDPIYLPAFFERVLIEYGTLTKAVYIVPPLYKDQTMLQAAWRYFRTFGMGGFFGLALRITQTKIIGQSIASVCKKRNVIFDTIKEVNSDLFLKHLCEIETDLIVSVSCPQIFSKSLIDLPSLGILNIHGAILPQYRGVLPSFWMLANGEKQAGVSIYYVNEKIDAGEICGQRIFEIIPGESLDHFIQRSKSIAADLLIDVLDKISNGTITRAPLDLSQGSYYSWPHRNTVKQFYANGHRLW